MTTSQFSSMRERFEREREERSKRLNDLLQRGRIQRTSSLKLATAAGSGRVVNKMVPENPSEAKGLAAELADQRGAAFQVEETGGSVVRDDPVVGSDRDLVSHFSKNSEQSSLEHFPTLDAFLQSLPDHGLTLSERERDDLAKRMARSLYEQISTGFFESFCQNYLQTYIRNKLTAERIDGDYGT